MALTFRNPSFSIDDDTQLIRFSGYDGMMEVRFSVERTTLEKLQGAAIASEIACRKAFNDWRDRIQQAALRAYRKGGGNSYALRADMV